FTSSRTACTSSSTRTNESCSSSALFIVSPCVDVRTLLTLARRGRTCGPQHGRNPAARVGGGDHIVDLEVARHVHRLAVLVHAVDHVLIRALALNRIRDRLQLAPLAEAHRPLEVHATELAGRPGHAEQRRLERAAGHRLRTETVTLAQDDRRERHTEI